MEGVKKYDSPEQQNASNSSFPINLRRTVYLAMDKHYPTAHRPLLILMMFKHVSCI